MKERGVKDVTGISQIRKMVGFETHIPAHHEVMIKYQIIRGVI